MERVRAFFRHIAPYIVALAKWLVIGGLVGLMGGVVGAAFHIGVEGSTELRLAYPWIIWLLPLGGMVIVLMYRSLHMEGKGTNRIIESVHFGKDVPILLVPLIFISTCLTHLLGGSAGREGAALQIGGGIGYCTGHALRLGEKELPLSTLCGMSAVFAALFGTPLTATIFALEVISVGAIYYAGLIPCLTAATVAFLMAGLLGVAPTRFAVVLPALEVKTLLLVALLAVGCALVSILFVRGMHWIEHLAARWLKNPYIRAVVGGFAIVGMTLLLGRDYNGAGMDVIARALSGDASHGAWLFKILFTAVTIGCGFKGGEVVPSFFVGATFGCVAGQLIGLPGGFGAAIGLIAVFCGAVNCPVASVLLSIELFGNADSTIYFAFACAISYLLSGYCGLYSSQTILYSKLRAEFINVHAKE